MASYQESRIHGYSSTEELKPTNPSTANAEAITKPEEQQDVTEARVTGEMELANAAGSQRSASPLRSESSFRGNSPDRARKFFQEKVHEVVRRARYGQWDFDFSPTSAHSSDQDKPARPPLTIPPWGPVSAKEIFSGILRPGWRQVSEDMDTTPSTIVESGNST